MPLLPEPDFRPIFPFTNGHLQTILPTLLRPRPDTSPVRMRLELDDGDFLDIDLHKSQHGQATRLAVISHGLEGSSRKKNVLGLVSILTRNGWDVMAYNFRGCSGEPNRLLRMYHSGVTDDLHSVLRYGLADRRYTNAVLIGFSMGGNQTLKYLGEDSRKVPSEVCGAVVFSVPCMLADSAKLMGAWQNRIYMYSFMRSLREKVRMKASIYPDLIVTEGLDQMKSFIPFDDRYTGPMHGFRDAAHYYARCSAKQFLPAVNVPTLVVQAQDDPFLPASCYPIKEAQNNPNLYLEMPRFGGHVGFFSHPFAKQYWHEARTIEFLRQVLGDSSSLNN